jgi:hypothetical protein
MAHLIVVLCLKADDHIVEYQATPDPVESDLKVPLILHWVTKIFEGLEASF